MTHGVERKSKATKVRPCQRVYYTVKKTRGYVGEYQTDGDTCSCSWFKNRLFCRNQNSGSGTIMDCQFSVGQYNKSFDKAKTFTDILPQFDNECFDSNLEFCYGGFKLLRSGVPKEL